MLKDKDQKTTDEINAIFKKTPLKTIIKKLFDTYPWLERYSYSGVGMELMYLESEIAIGVIKDFLDHNWLVLTIHDSFICEQEHEEFLRKSMIKNFQEVLKTEIDPII